MTINQEENLMSYSMEEIDKALRAFFNPKIKNAPDYIRDEIMQYSSIRKHLTEAEYQEYLEFGPRIRR